MFECFFKNKPFLPLGLVCEIFFRILIISFANVPVRVVLYSLSDSVMAGWTCFSSFPLFINIFMNLFVFSNSFFRTTLHRLHLLHWLIGEGLAYLHIQGLCSNMTSFLESYRCPIKEYKSNILLLLFMPLCWWSEALYFRVVHPSVLNCP